MPARARLFIQVYTQTWSIAEAAKRSGTSRAAHYKRMERDPRYKAEFDEAEAVIADTIRGEVRRQAMDGHRATVILSRACSRRTCFCAYQPEFRFLASGFRNRGESCMCNPKSVNMRCRID
jgi:hypothetical protein